MKKIASLLAGAAVLAMAVPAAAGNNIYQGSVGSGFTYNIPFVGTVGAGAVSNNTLLVGAADGLNALGSLPGYVALFTIDGNGRFSDNLGNETPTVNVTFSLKGNVTPHCVYFVGNADKNIDFGEIGINTMDVNPNAAFQMVGNAPSVDIDTNLAGCNSRNQVGIWKTNLKNNSATTQGYDPAVFTDTLDITATANYKAGAVGSTSAVAGAANHIVVAANENWKTAQHGAWKSPMRVTLNIANPTKALVAGTYTSSVAVEIRAY